MLLCVYMNVRLENFGLFYMVEYSYGNFVLSKILKICFFLFLIKIILKNFRIIIEFGYNLYWYRREVVLGLVAW